MTERRRPGRAARPRPAARARAPLVVAAVALLAFAVELRAGFGGRTVLRYVDDIGTGVAAAGAAAGAFLAARYRPGSSRTAWRLVGAGAAVWAAGEAVWCYYDLYLGHQPPAVSLASVGFWTFPVFAAAALLSLPARGEDSRRARWVLDSLIVAASVLLVAWTTVLNTAWPVTAVGDVTAIYPVIDIALLSLTVLTGAQTMDRSRISVIGLSIGLLVMADTSYGYLAAMGRYRAGAWCDVAYFAAFALFAATSFLSREGSERPAPPPSQPSWLRDAAPYAPLTIAAGVAAFRWLQGQHLGTVSVAIWATIMMLVLTRQSLVVTDNRRLFAQLRAQKDAFARIAHTDPLTGLANRVLFATLVEQALERRAAHGGSLAVCWIDLDDFKVVNDTLGHAAGDELLALIGSRLQSVIGAGDTLARLGGDEFAVLLHGNAEPVRTGRRLLDELARPFALQDRPITVQASAGVAVVTGEDRSPSAEELLARADIAMYTAKQQGKNLLVRHEPGMALPGAQDLALRAPLRLAIAERTITLDYQPVLRVSSGEIMGFEALARWRHADRPVPPDRFIPLAEKYGLIGRLGDQLLDAALGQLASWSSLPFSAPLSMSVNLAPDQLVDPELPRRVVELLGRHGVAAGRLCLEITEGALLTESPLALRVTRELSDAGVALALDDFGIGYSSLAHLRGFPLDVLKIDKAFVSDIDRVEQSATFVGAVLRLGRDLGLHTVAEGIERAGQLDVLRRLDCDLIQGYLVSRPLAPEAATAFLRAALAGGMDGPGGGRPAVPGPRAELGAVLPPV